MIDLRTIFICAVAIELFLVPVMFLYWKNQKTYPGFLQWTLGILSLLIAHLFYSFRGQIPDFISISLGNVFLLLSVFLKLEALKLYFGGFAFRREIYLLFIPLLLVFDFFTVYIDSAEIRNSILSVAGILILSNAVHVLLTHRYHENMLFSRLFAALYALFGLILFGRLLEWWLVPAAGGLLTSSFFNNALLLLDMVISIVTTLIFLLMNAQRINHELELSRMKAQDFANRYSHAVKSANACVWGLDLDTGELFWDETLDKLCGSHIGSREQLQRICQSFGLDVGNLPNIRNVCDLNGGEDGLNAEFNFCHNDGGMRYLLVHAITVCGGTSPNRLSGLIYDLTSLRKAENALKESHRKLNLLTGVTRHDILNRINIVRGFGELLTQSIIDPKQQEMAGKIVESADVISDMMSFTGLYQDVGMNDPEWQDIAAILASNEISTLVSDIALTSPEPGTMIYADVMFEKLLFNLIENSLRHGGAVNSISLSYEYSGKSLNVIYQDDGIGVPEDDKKQIFERNYGKNTGMGLFFCKEILEITGLSILENGVFGEGARFEIMIPPGYFRMNTQGTFSTT